MFVCLVVTFWPIISCCIVHCLRLLCLNYLTFAKDYLTRQSPAVTMWCAQVLLLCVLLLFSHFSFTNFERESIADHDCVRNSSYLLCYYNFATTTIFTHKKLERSYGYCLYTMQTRTRRGRSYYKEEISKLILDQMLPILI